MKQTPLLLILVLSATSLFGEVVYSSIEAPLPPNEPSIGYEATSAAEFGNAINIVCCDANLTTVSVVMSNWAYQSDNLAYEEANPTLANSIGYYVPLTMNLYNTDPSGDVLSSLGSETIDALITWRPEPNPGECAPGSNNDYQASDTSCYAGDDQVVTFDFTGDGITLPSSLIWGLSYNTSDYGAAPTGVPDAPYDSLNLGVGGNGELTNTTSTPSVGSDMFPGSVYWNTGYAGFLTPGGPGVAGQFSQDTEWAPYNDPNVLIDATSPEPGTFVLLGGAIALLAFGRHRTAAGTN